MEDRYDVQQATNELNTKRTNIGNELVILKRERQKCGQSIYDLEKSTNTMTGKFAKARGEELLQTNRDRIKDIETSMSKLEQERSGLTVSSFMGDGKTKDPDMDLKRSTMDDKSKLAFISKNGMGKYKELNY